MKAYSAWNEYTGFATVVFAETAGKAKAILISTDCFEGFEFTEIRPYRVPELDKEYRGHSEMDWCDDQDRIALVKQGWHCADDAFRPDECVACPAGKWCERRSEADAEN